MKKFYEIGQRPSEIILHPAGDSPLARRRLPLTRRHLLKWRSRTNPKTLQQERMLADKRPLWWAIGLGALLVAAPFLSNPMLTIAAIFCIFAAINVLWTLVIGTAGIFSLATLAIVGIGAYASAGLNIWLGLPWPLMFVAGGIAGLIVGGFLALPSTRLDGLYYALLTMGFAEICRVFVQQLKVLTPANGSINNVGSFIPADWQLQRPGLLLGFAGAFVILLLALLIFRIVNSERLGMLLQAAREDEAFAEATGIDFRRARLHVFLISSAGLGVIGAFYAQFYGSISPSIFSLDQLMLLFAMIVIGGLGRSEGAVIGTAIVVLIDKGLLNLGPIRILLVAALMLAVTPLAHNGLVGIREQFRGWRNRKKSEARARRTEKGGEVMPEEAIEFADKQEIYYRRFQKRLRDRLKALITPELIEEHRQRPLGQHSDALNRVLNHFRRGEVADKYAIMRQPGQFHSYKIVAFSGVRGAPPRLVDDKIYEDINQAYHAVFLLRVNDLMES
ncbi:MAG: branched-chain amino acid ABC transporter permease [Rhodobacterales bacterium RIFCSPHIGHO2_02_FULL_62_130]|nr:MAG: branched-chain amino acid ABC transporter permease [Rhodobacterales bacterium RIFCSPHIGHO2_02_FULL_62_130]OHC61040.1 MAG: branched-chain amino acid ABC transporter permease [Rhodobacterales bacterium RIFCSPHIGHO2_12_FULL_62_75]